MVAFHFQFSNRAGWDCESCRKHGLEARRRCGFLPAEKRATGLSAVWGRKRLQTHECPTSLITAESMSFLEEYFVGRRLGFPESPEIDARKADAFLILREQVEREEYDGTSQH